MIPHKRLTTQQCFTNNSLHSHVLIHGDDNQRPDAMRAGVEDGALRVVPITVLVARFFHKVPAVAVVMAELKHDWVVPAELLSTAHVDLWSERG